MLSIPKDQKYSDHITENNVSKDKSNIDNPSVRRPEPLTYRVSVVYFPKSRGYSPLVRGF